MGIVRWTAPIAVVLAFVAAVTAILWFLKSAALGPPHLVFYYLLPTAIVATFYGSLPAMLYAILATLCAEFFFYDPVYGFYVTSALDAGELVCFVGLAVIGAKCAADLFQPLLPLAQHNAAAKKIGR